MSQHFVVLQIGSDEAVIGKVAIDEVDIGGDVANKVDAPRDENILFQNTKAKKVPRIPQFKESN